MNISIINHIQPTTSQPLYSTMEEKRILPIKYRPILAWLDENDPMDGILIPLHKWLFNDGFADEVHAVRNEKNIIRRDELMARLPVACIGKYLPNAKYYDGFSVGYTGLLDFAIEANQNPNFNIADIRNELATLPEMVYIGYGCTGKNLYCIVPILNPVRYDEHYRALRRQFDKAGIRISGSDDAGHRRRATHDPQAYFNGNAKTFTLFE